MHGERDSIFSRLVVNKKTNWQCSNIAPLSPINFFIKKVDHTQVIGIRETLNMKESSVKDSRPLQP